MPNKKYKAVRGKTLTSRQKKVMDLQDENLSNEDILNKMQNKGMTQKKGEIRKKSGINMGIFETPAKMKGSPLYKKILTPVSPFNKSRCWAGYEPVPGKKPYSKGSCRKK